MRQLFQTGWAGKLPKKLGFGMVTLLFFVLFSGQIAFAGMKEYPFEIPSQKISTALDLFAEKTNYSILYSLKDIGHIITRKVSGLYTADQALDIMLQGTGLVHNKTSDTSISIKQGSSKSDTAPASDSKALETTDQPVLTAAGDQANEAGDQVAGQTKSRPAGDYTLEDTIVTATKTGATKLQETPIAITAISSEELKARSTFNMKDIAQLSPNTEILSSGGDSTAYIRGIGTQNVVTLTEPNVAIYLDGVYLERGMAAFNDFVDVERIEVMRGPQGTIYGRNSTGGAINIITKMPTDELTGTASVEYGSFDKQRFDGSVAGPIIKDKLNGRLTVTAGKSDSHFDVVAGPDPDENSLAGARGVLDFKPSDTVDFTLRGDYMEDEYNSPRFKLLNDDGLLGMLGYTLPPDFSDVKNDYENNRDRTNYGLSGHLTIDLPNDNTLRSITAYRKYEESRKNDSDGTDLTLYHIIGETDLEQFSQELQLDGSYGRLNWLVGVFYYHMKESQVQTQLYDLVFPGFKLEVDVDLITDAYALFSNIDFKVTDKFSIGAGIRYSYEEKDVKNITVEDPFPVFGLQPTIEKDDWDAVTPKIGAEYQINSDAMVYGSIATGFRSGTFGIGNMPPNSPKVDAETNLSYEIGIKTDWLDKRLRINAAAFLSQYEDMQVYAIVNGLGTLTNAAESTIKGLEIEVLAMPMPALVLNFTGGYLDAEYDEFMSIGSGGLPVDVSGNQMPYVPEISMNMGAQYVFDLKKSGFITVRSDLSYKDKVFFTPTNDDLLAQDSLWLLKAFIRYEPQDARWSLEAYGKNLTDEEYYTSMSALLPGDRVGEVAQSRTFGVRFTYNF